MHASVYISASFRVIVPILPLLIFLLSIFRIGVIKLPELVKNTSSALTYCLWVICFSINLSLVFFIIFKRDVLVTPFKISELAG